MKNTFIKAIIFSFLITSFFSCAKKGAFFSYNANSHRYVKAEKSTAFEAEEEQVMATTETSVPAEIKEVQVAATKEVKQSVNKGVKNESLTKAEKKELKKEVKVKKKEIRSVLKEAKKENSTEEVNTILLIVLAIFLPPLAVALVRGIGGAFWLNILLTLLFILPGIIHALYIVLSDRE